MTRYRIISWRDIPTQVKVRNGNIRLSRPLSPRFQKTIHRAAYRAKAITGDDYINAWQLSEWHEREGAAEDVILAVIAELETAYDEEHLVKLALSKGYEAHDG